MPSSSTTSTPQSSPKSSSFASSSSLHFSSPSSSSASDPGKDRLPFSAPGNPPPAPFRHRNLPPAPSILPHPSSPSNALIRTIQSLRQNSSVDDPDTVFHVNCSDIRAFYRELRHPTIFSGSDVDSLRFNYDPTSCTLTLRCMITPIHEALGHLVMQMKDNMIFDHFLTRAQARHLLINTNSSVALPSSVRGSKFRVAAMKQPDAAFQFADPAARLEAFPRVVFEAAFSQSYESVKDYAAQWLLRSEGAVKLVVVIKLFEAPIAVLDEDPAPETDEHDDAESPASSPGSSFSNASGYTNFLNTVDPTLWVGRISGFLELYRYDSASKTIYIDGPRYNLYPTVEQPLPRINIADLLPGTHIQGDATRSYPIPLQEYRELIAMGVRGLALLRKAERSRKRKGRLSDGYVTDGSVEGEGSGKRMRGGGE